MRFALALLLLLPFAAYAEDVSLTCDPPTQMEDGSSIASPITYRLYSAQQGVSKSLVATLTECKSIRLNVKPGEWCWAVTAVVNGAESGFSNEVCRTIAAPPPKPKAPVNLRSP